ncbi:LPXTG cell wall anchor domain-containing protein [Streptomyces sp. P9(2023)]|uniref:LPXTG cell wall anchor domain-containing protein n=1 Tax=Streptomyces sp. P9(2023) TaxID=3064394 RepID=UPI0028F405E7|nr:LPXTG cell wall anchor domain-containing protein [Streptomyces sp. P9(2023)]MDT9692754.1 LPXTG cell wall anchor domain-containing protein [Streptomyces sp. P9(2023)]
MKRRLSAALAVISTAGMLLIGLPSTASAAPGDYAKITTGSRCDKMHLKKTFPRTPNNSGAPTGQHHWTKSGPDEEFYYNNSFKGWETVPAPTQAELSKLTGSDAEIRKWDTAWAKSKNPEDMRTAIYSRYQRYLSGTGTKKPFAKWKVNLISAQHSKQKGGVFERKAVQDFNLIGPDWMCEVTIEIYDKDGNKIASRRYDAYNQRTGELGEFKSDGKRKPGQFKADKVILRHKDAKYDFTRSRLTMFTSEKPNGATVRDYKAENTKLRAERGTGNNPIRIAERRATAKGLWPQTKYTKSYPVFNPRPNTGTQGPINSIAYGSGKNPAQARQIQNQHNQANTRSVLGRGPGGVDFSTLELQYVGNPVKGKGLDYSMKADLVPDEDTEPGYGGQAKLELASDALFTWLALTPDRIWVNLNPDQPETIMDKGFGQTDTGRVLLVADMEMKRDFSRAMNPKESPGKEFMNAAPKVNGVPCWGSGRNWIVPGRAKVREQDGGIYILDAPLKVNHAAMDFTTPVPGERCDTKLSKAEKEYSHRLIDRYLVPHVQEKINTDPKYADLRRVYKSRVAAEWIRLQDAEKATDFRPIINSNDLKRWPLRGENADWDKRTVWKEMVKSFTEGDFTYEWPLGDGRVYTFFVGGVDFSKAPKRNVSGVEFTTQHRELPRTTKDSVRAQTSARDSDTAFLGGNGSAATDDGTPDPTPTPTPTGPGKPDPTPTPTAPDPDPTDGQSSPPTSRPDPKDPDGDLADTGSDTPVGLIAGIAAAAVAAGGALVWWRRRRANTEN